MNEFVMVIKTSLLDELGAFQGLNFEIENYLERIYSEHFFINRKDAENDYSYKQIIPYVILNYNKMIVSYMRGKLTGEKRLKNKYSIGIGGHVTLDDQNLFNTPLYEARHREIREEVVIKTNFTERAVALINDDSNNVGRVHLGIVYVFELEEPNVNKKEKSINKLEFVLKDTLKKNILKYESWSQICIKDINKIL